MKKSFILYIDVLSTLSDLSNNDLGELFHAIINYQLSKKYSVKNELKIVLKMLIAQFERDDIKYSNTVEKRRIAGSKGGKVRAKQMLANASKCKQIKQTLANQADSDSDSVNDSDSDSDKIYTSILEKFNQLCDTTLRLTDKKKKQINNRLKTFKESEIIEAIRKRTTLPWYKGENSDKKIWFKDWDSLMRNDEKIENILNYSQVSDFDLSSIPDDQELAKYMVDHPEIIDEVCKKRKHAAFIYANLYA